MNISIPEASPGYVAFPVKTRGNAGTSKGSLGLSTGGTRAAFLQTQQSVDLGMLDRDPSAPAAVDITVTPASSLPCNLTYSQGKKSYSSLYSLPCNFTSLIVKL